MQQQFPPSLTRLDAVLWFLRVQLWLSIVTLLSSFISPFGFFVGGAVQNLLFSVLPVLVLLVFPRVLASAMLGQSAREPLSSLGELRPLLGRCIGITLFVGSLGRAVYLGLAVVDALISRRNLSFGGAYSGFLTYQIIGAGLSFFLGFALAFGPAIRDGLRGR